MIESRLDLIARRSRAHDAAKRKRRKDATTPKPRAQTGTERRIIEVDLLSDDLEQGLVYAAGALDLRGRFMIVSHTSHGKYVYYSPSISISCPQEAPIRHLATIIGGRYKRSKGGPRYRGEHIRYELWLHGEVAAALCRKISHLLHRKQEQARIIIELDDMKRTALRSSYSIIEKRKHGPCKATRRRFSPQQFKQQAALKDRCAAVNKEQRMEGNGEE